jgi:thiamine-phosphate pyrophosphorylase
VNGRADLALAAGADGVHLPAGGVGANDLSSWIPAGFLVGASVHSLKEARTAVSSGADYLLAGPVFETPSKMRYGSPLGLTAFRRICAQVSIPILALGGIHPENVPSVLAAGASGIAGISLFQHDLKSRPISRDDLVRGFPPSG